MQKRYDAIDFVYLLSFSFLMLYFLGARPDGGT
jgi:hypothetical protein